MYMQAQDITASGKLGFRDQTVACQSQRGVFIFQVKIDTIAQVVNITFIRNMNTTRLDIMYYELI